MKTESNSAGDFFDFNRDTAWVFLPQTLIAARNPKSKIKKNEKLPFPKHFKPFQKNIYHIPWLAGNPQKTPEI